MKSSIQFQVARKPVVVTLVCSLLRSAQRTKEGRLHIVVSLTRGSWALFPPGDRELTGRQPSGNLLLLRWKVDVWRGGLSLKSESPRQSPYTNVLIIINLYNGVVRWWRRVQDNR